MNKKSLKKQVISKLVKIFQSDIITNAFDLGINSNCIAVLKLDNDSRNYDWHVSF